MRALRFDSYRACQFALHQKPCEQHRDRKGRSEKYGLPCGNGIGQSLDQRKHHREQCNGANFQPNAVYLLHLKYIFPNIIPSIAILDLSSW
jgi:hypothetical protein